MNRRLADLRWLFVALATALPIAAILHHALFYRHTCMLKPFGADYTLDVVALWLRHDPSPTIALVAALALYATGLWRPSIRPWAMAFVLAFLPLSLWIWDIPFTGRIICRLFHDGRVPLSSRHLYMAGAAIYSLAAARIVRARRHRIEQTTRTT